MDELEFGVRSVPTRYEIVFGKMINGKLDVGARAGIALSYEGEEHYVLILSMFPNNRYYLLKNKDSATDYTIYSRRVADAGAQRTTGFHYPVGSGRLLSEVTTHLELRFPLFPTGLFMSLFGKG